MQSWAPGVERCPNGRSVRQIPQVLPVWSSSLWITKVGEVFRRYYNISTKLWHFDDTPVELIESSGRVGLKMDNHFVDLPMLIALAWRRMAPQSSQRVYSIAGDAALHARHLRFEEEEGAEEAVPIPNETWKPLKWRIGAASCTGRGYHISNKGRLRSDSGQVTAGVFFANTRWAACRDVGLVDLLAAAGLVPHVLTTTPAIKNAYDFSQISPSNLPSFVFIFK